MEILKQTEEKMNKAITVLEADLKTIRTGVAHASLLDHVQFEYYGSMTPINQVASVKVVEGRQLLIKPYDRNTLKDIERAIQTSDTGLVPQSDGEVIRLNVPALTEERRKELAKSAHKMGEDAKIAIRNIRRDAMDTAKKSEKAKEITEDDLKDLENNIQKVTDDAVKEADRLASIKEKELLDI